LVLHLCLCVVFLFRKYFFQKNCFTWWNKWNKIMFGENWQISFIQQQALIYGCLNDIWYIDFCYLILWGLIGNLNKWISSICLRQQRHLIRPWLSIWHNWWSIWVEKKNHCICQRWGDKFECYGNYLDIYCEMWSLGFRWKISRYLFQPYLFLRHVNKLLSTKLFL